MTDRIDLDDIETETDDEPDANHGDWLWRDEGDPADEPDAPTLTEADTEAAGTAERSDADADPGTVSPRVPRENEDKPAGVPTNRGGSGAGAGVEAGDDTGEGLRTMSEGPHGGGIDDTTLALTYGAASRLDDPQLVVAAAREWADWVGIVGEVSAPVITKFQREHGIDADFFNGTGTGPAERLAGIGETSMFFAERMVVVGTPDEAWIAEESGWEFVPFEEAAEKAGWTTA
jgi:hypothetical protein